MSEILFKAKRRDTEKWVEGYYMCLHGINGAEDSHFVIDKHGEYNFMDPDTVREYTGLNDYNDRKIFENDICEFTVFDCFVGSKTFRGVVVYYGSRFMLCKSKDGEDFETNEIFDLDWVVENDDDFAVVGNIFDCPELIGGVLE